MISPGGEAEEDISMSRVLSTLPIMRGGKCLQDGEQKAWSIAGTSRKVRKVKKNWAKVTLEEKAEELSITEEVKIWEKILPLEFLQDMFSEKFALYRCPECKSTI